MNKELLYKLYILDKKPMHTIAKELGFSIGTVFNYLKKYDIKTRDQKETFNVKGRKRPPEECKRIGDFHRGKILSAETKQKIAEGRRLDGIGHRKTRSDGYIYLYFPRHPKSTKDGYIMEHILIMERLIGRCLSIDECVHHINEKRNDNSPENLKLMTKSSHMSFHAKKRWATKKEAIA